MIIHVHQADLLTATTDAIVNPANSEGSMGGGVALAIKLAGGQSIEDEARAQAPIPVGQAILTTAGTLPYKAIIHAPTMEHPAEPIPDKQVELATMAALRLADEQGYETIALPALGTGIGQVDPEVAARIMVETIQMYMVDDALQEAHIYTMSEQTYTAFSVLVL